MRGLVVTIIRALSGAFLSLVLVGSLSACYGPSQTMMIAHRAPDGSLTFTVPICQGGAPDTVMVAADRLDRGELFYRHQKGEPWTAASLEFVVSDQAVRDGHLNDFGLLQDSTWSTTGVQNVGDLNWVRVTTSMGAVSVDPRVLSNANGTDWVVRGILHEGNSPGPAVTAEQAQTALREYCK